MSQTKWVPQGYEKVTSLDTAKGITSAVIKASQFIIIIPQAQSVWYRDDGTNPTGTTGMEIPVGEIFTYSGDLTAIKFIEDAASCILHISGYS